MGSKENLMGSMDEHILKTAKEITVKFIETGRVSPTGFNETFKSIYKAVEEAVKSSGSTQDEKEKK
jgi:hypothetical protein